MIYIFVLILLIVGIFNYDLANKTIKSNRTLYYIIGFLLFFIAAFRYYNGGDTFNYSKVFNMIPVLDNIKESDYDNFRYQSGYVYFVSFLKSIYDNFLIQQIITALFINIILFRFVYKYSNFAYTAILVYFLLNYFEFNMEIMRECIAIAFGLLAYEFIQNRRFGVVILLMYLAYQFHVSALILLIMPLVSNIQFTKKSFYIILAVSAFLPTLYLAIPNLAHYATLLFNQADWVTESYINQEYNKTLSVNFYIGHVFKYIVVPFGIIWYINKRLCFKYNGFVYTYAMLQLLSMFSYAFYRFANYYAPFYWIAIATFLCMFLKKHAKYRFLLIWGFILLFLYSYQNVQFLWDKNNMQYFYNRYLPYKFILFYDGY